MKFLFFNLHFSYFWGSHFLEAFVVKAHHVFLAASSATEDVVHDTPTPTMSQHSLGIRP